MSNKVLGLAILGLSLLSTIPAISSGNSQVDPRIPITCSYVQSTTKGYERLELYAFLNPRQSLIDFTFITTSKEGISAPENSARETYKMVNGKLLIPLVSGTQNSLLSVSSEILASAKPVAATWANREVSCELLKVGLDNYLTPAEFDRYNLPQTEADNKDIKVKTFKTSDGKFSLVASLYPAAPSTKNYPAVPALTLLDVAVGGLLVDDQPDLTRYMGYLLAAGSHKIVEVKIDSASDVQGLISMMGSTTGKYSLTTSIDHQSPVTVSINCLALTSCVIRASN